ncbi:MAG: competence/damage-inducible protein A [Rhodothermales bacterium]|nr:competence/damage-inducible protein A [Rhodothermales bacterium]
MSVTLVSVGDELLVGQVVNTNAAWLGEYLTGIGMMPVRSVVVGDSIELIDTELCDAFSLSDLVVVTGGLGPTHDDVTRHAVARFLGVGLHLEEKWFGLIERRFSQRGMTVPERNRIQAMIPDGMEVLANRVGTAPGFWKSWVAESGPKAIAVLPGVPGEMKSMMEEQVRPRLEPLTKSPVRQITLQTTGIGESHLQELLAAEVEGLSDILSLAYLPSLFGVRLRITERLEHGGTGEAAERLANRLTDLAGVHVYGRGEDRLEAVVGKMLERSGQTVAVAESCTGGAICNLLTNVAGASVYVAGGVVAYSNRLKRDVLKVEDSVIVEHGAVSEAVATGMARGVRLLSGADVGLSTTGILGPAGGTPSKPVGTVWIAYVDRHGEEARQLSLGQDRLKNKQRAVAATLDLLRRRLMEADSGGREAV